MKSSAKTPSPREQAQATWNQRACGEQEGDKDSLAYFDEVSAWRYAEHPWMKSYFGYENFAGKRVLEIGIGQGSDLVTFAAAGAEVHGVDITDNHLALTARNFALRGLEVDLRKADAAAIPFPDNYFDCVYSMGVLHHIPDIENVIAEIRRVLRPGGMLLVSVYNKWSAFHLCWKLLENGIRRGWLFRLGYAGLLSTIEGGADGKKVKPYVKLYTERSLAGVLEGFEIEDMTVHHLGENHFWPRPLASLLAKRVEQLEPRLGWYINAKARVKK